MGTGASTESQGISSNAPAPTQAELAQITSAVLANQRQQQQAQYVPPQASVYVPPAEQLYTPPAQQVYTPPAAQVATPGITALLPQDQGAQTSMPTASVYTPPVAQTYTPPAEQIYTPPAASVYTPPASQIFTPPAAPEPVPQDKNFPTASVAPATQQAPQLAAPTLNDALTAMKMSLGKLPMDTKYDVNGDGVVDTTDYVGLQKAYLGKDPGFAFSGSSFASPSTKTAEDYAAEAKANQERIAAEQKETERRQGLLADAQKLNGQVSADLVANNPNLNAQQLSSLARRNYWSNESEAFSRVMSGMESGKAQLKEVQTGYMDETGNPETELRMIAPDGPPGYNSLTLRPTPTPGVYQFSTPNQVAGGMIHGVIQADPKTGEYKPVADYTKQIHYTPGTSGSVLGGMIGGLGDIYKSLGPIGTIIGNGIMPGLGSALSAVAALDEGNTSGAILSGLSAAGAYGGDAAQNALAAEVSGNADLASQYSSGLGGALAQNLPEIKTATSAAQLANAIDKGSVLGAINAGANLTGAQLPSELKTGIAGLAAAQALASGNIPQLMSLGAQLAGPVSQNADVGPPAPPAGEVASLLETQPANTETVATAPAQEVQPPADTNAAFQQLVQAINNPETTASYPGTQVADLSGTTGLPSDQPTDEDLEQLGVGLPAVETQGIEKLIPAIKAAEEPAAVETPAVETPAAKTETPAAAETGGGGIDTLLDSGQGEGAFPGTKPGTVASDLDQYLEVDPEEPRDSGQGEGAFPGTAPGTVASDQPTGGTNMDDLDLGDFGGIDMTGGDAGKTPDDFDGIDMTGGGAGQRTDIDVDQGQGEGAFPGTQPGKVGSDQPSGNTGLTPSMWEQLSTATGLSPGLLKLLAGSLGLGGLGSLLGQQQQAPAQTPYTGPLSNVTFNPATYTPYTYKPYAGGGAVGEVMNNNGYTIGVGYPDHVSELAPSGTAMAAGGIANLGSYSDGGRLLRGPGDGVSDSIPAVIGNKQPARLADGEFVVPARIVSELGNGSTEAGARQLYAMMDRIQAARRKTVGKDKVAANTKAAKHLPA